MRRVGLFFVLLFISSAAAQVGIQNPEQSTPETLYFHLDAHQDFPINTQLPDDRYAKSESLGLLAPTTSCLPDAVPQLSKSFHTYYGFSTPGYVEYDFQEKGGPRIHPERGLAGDVRLDGNAPATLYWYLQTQFAGGDSRGGETVDNLPVVIPQVTVRATMRTGDDISIGAQAYNEGAVIAQGESEPMLVAPDTTNPHYLPQDDGSHLYEFVVPMDIQQDTIGKDDSYNIRVDIFVALPGCDSDPDASIMTSNVQVHTSPEFRPRLEFSILNPVEIEFIHPQFVDDKLLIHTAFNSPWGNYDVDETPGGIEVTISGPTEARSLVRSAFVQRHHEHGHHFEPVDVSYVWPYKLDQAEKGEYTIEVRAKNDQGTGEAIGHASFDLGSNTARDANGDLVEQSHGAGEEASPAIGPVAGLALLGFALLRRR